MSVSVSIECHKFLDVYQELQRCGFRCHSSYILYFLMVQHQQGLPLTSQQDQLAWFLTGPPCFWLVRQVIDLSVTFYNIDFSHQFKQCPNFWMSLFQCNELQHSQVNCIDTIRHYVWTVIVFARSMFTVWLRNIFVVIYIMKNKWDTGQIC